MANYKRWLPSEMDYIANNCVLLPDEILALKLSHMTGQNITTSMVRRQRRKLKISKPKGRPFKVNKDAVNPQQDNDI